MASPDVLTQICNVVIENQRQVREVRAHLEALKSMMFEHRPQFRPEFERHLQAVSASDGIRAMDGAIQRLESLAQALSSTRQK